MSSNLEMNNVLYRINAGRRERGAFNDAAK
jgi:hypothetical protein